MTDQPKLNPAGIALFQMQFGVLMLNWDRTEEASKAFEKAQAILTKLEIDLERLRTDNASLDETLDTY